MKRIEITTTTSAVAIVLLASACNGHSSSSKSHTDGGDVSTPGATTYELRKPAGGGDPGEVVIHNVRGNVDSIVNALGAERKITIYGIAADSVTTTGPPRIIVVGPGPKQ